MLQKVGSMAVKFKEIDKQIENDINSAVESIEKEVFFIIDSDLDFYFLKEFTKYYPRCLIRRKAETLLDTVLNYLLTAALEEVRALECEKQYEFFRLNLRDKIKKKLMNEYPEEKIRPLKIDEKENPAIKLAAAIPGLLVAFSGVAAMFYTLSHSSENLPLGMVSAGGAISGLIYALAKVRAKSRIKSIKDSWKRQVDSYLKSVKKDIKEWLHLALFEFSFEWEGFCGKSTGFVYEVKDKPVEVIHDSQFQ